MRDHFRLPVLGACFMLAGVACGAVESGAGDSIEALPVEQVLEFSTDSDSGPAIRWISDAAILGDGRVALLDGSSQAIHILEPSGSLFRSIERPGEGPGEFRRPTWIRSCRGDSLFVWDPGQARISVLSPEGDFVRQFRLPIPEPIQLSCGGDGMLAALDGSDVPLGAPAPETAATVLRASVILVNAEGDSIASIPDLPVGAQQVLGSRGMLAVTSGVILSGVTTSPLVQRFGFDGRAAGIDSLPLTSGATTDSIFDAEVDRMAGSTGSSSGPIYERIREMLARAGKPDSLPLFRAILADEDGYWVLTSLATDTVTTLLGLTNPGEFRRIVISGAVEPLQFRNHRLVARVKDAGGTQRVIVYRY